ncbi:hypothetical protein AALP_AA4G239600 [Arabis alpina]|uniref:Uncharacterized protein n=1 Tax=Arabis alpina TaxID=50452 RepID=A0A087H5A0_ARAAL|nr:hypothetical protein AALP_AA4G239600 [Arabis alpina]
MTMNLLFGLTCFLLNLAHCFNPKKLNVSAVGTAGSDWSSAGATWYGSPTGYGSDGGACGYGNTVAQPPFSAMVSAGGASLFKSGEGCGACYQIKCTSKSACSGNPVTVVITDECPGCVTESVHFDLSGTSFGAMAISGQDSQLRNVGVLQILYRKVECNYVGKTVTFKVEEGSNTNYFAALVEYEDGDGEIGRVELKQALDSDTWLTMSHLWGAVWRLDVTSPLRAPLSLRVTSLDSSETVVASNVIPAGWKPAAGTSGSGWSSAGATWYGSPTGYGSDGGACGYRNDVAQAPFSSMVSAGGPSLFKSGKGCGACYQVKCTSNSVCSGNPVTVVITDECPGCVTESVHFDLSGTSFGAMAKSGQDSQLRNVGVLQILYKKVECNYNGETVTFRVDEGSNTNYFAALVEYVNGDGEIGRVELKQASNSDTWLTMSHSWGAVWKLDVTSPLRAPLSLRVTSVSGETVVASNVIPAGWKPGAKYKSNVNF